MKTKRIAGILLFSIIVVAGTSPQSRALLRLPDILRLSSASRMTLPTGLRFWHPEAHGVAQIEGETLSTNGPGRGEVDFRLFRGGPVVRSVQVRANESRRVIPSGESVGIVLNTDGPMVVGESRLPGHIGYPARSAGVLVGDRIVEINGHRIVHDEQVASIVEQLGRRGQPAQLVLVRGRERLRVPMRPQLDAVTHRYRLGLFIKDRVSGVGTLTFTDPQRSAFAALGHQVSDPLRRPMPARGTVVPASIVGFERGLRGHPGEKVGILDEDVVLGQVLGNSPVGLVGHYHGPMAGPLIPVAQVAEVHPGRATMWTVASGNRVGAFSVLLERVYPQRAKASKGLVLRVTDRKLLKASGGIVQGMSGSPILQDGKLVGAVTHVFVGDPTRGYGVFAQWMLHEMDASLQPSGHALSNPKKAV